MAGRPFILLASALLLCITDSGWTAEKRALLIGVGSYPPGIRGLPGAPQDAARLAEFLQVQFQFPRSHITLLNAPETTGKAGIVAALQALARSTQPGDVVFISFSGHGSLAADRDGDEVDGYDEVLVASEGRPRGDIPDDEIQSLLRRILERKPANVTFVVDACNSGGASRGTWTPRLYPGTPQIQGHPLDAQWASRQGVLDCLYAARSGEAAADMASGGAFTEALLAVAKPGMRCEDLVAGIRERIRFRQHPYGEFTPGRTFLGTAPAPIPTYRIYDVRGPTATLSAGAVQGMHEGTILGVYAGATPLRPIDLLCPPTDERLLARARVMKTQPFTSVVEVADQGALVEGAKVLILSRSYGEMRVPVLVEGASEHAGLLAELRSSDLLQVVTDRARPHNLWLARGRSEAGATWEIRDPGTGSVLPARTADDDPVEAVFPDSAWRAVRRALETYAQAVNLRELQNAEWDATARAASSVRVEAVELVNGDPLAAPERDGVVELRKGRQVRLRLHNVPKEDLSARTRERYRYYFGVLTIAPDGEIVFLAPRGGTESVLLPRTPEEKPLVVGDSPDPRQQLEAASASPGTEYFKIIISRVPLELLPLEQPPVSLGPLPETLKSTVRGRPDTAPPRDPLNQLLQRASRGTRSGESPTPVPALDWFTVTVPYRVVE